MTLEVTFEVTSLVHCLASVYIYIHIIVDGASYVQRQHHGVEQTFAYLTLSDGHMTIT